MRRRMARTMNMEALEITDNYIKCRIPYDEKVLEMSKKMSV